MKGLDFVAGMVVGGGIMVGIYYLYNKYKTAVANKKAASDAAFQAAVVAALKAKAAQDSTTAPAATTTVHA